MPVDNRGRRMMEHLGKALVRAIRSSSDVSEAVRRIRYQGFSLYLVLSREPEGEDRDRRLGGTEIDLSARPAPPSDARPEFRLNSGDVAFLESVGIDPTRRGRRRKRRRGS